MLLQLLLHLLLIPYSFRIVCKRSALFFFVFVSNGFGNQTMDSNMYQKPRLHLIPLQKLCHHPLQLLISLYFFHLLNRYYLIHLFLQQNGPLDGKLPTIPNPIINAPN